MDGKRQFGDVKRRVSLESGSEVGGVDGTVWEGVESPPGWSLSDLYESPESPRFSRDMECAESDAKAFCARYEGKIENLARTNAKELASAVSAFEALEELLGRMVSYADLSYAVDTKDSASAKFLGDVREKVTKISSSLLFFVLELSVLDDETLASAINRSSDLAHYRPWIEDVRKERPHRLDARTERLFLEKSITSSDAWSRLFDETLSTLQFNVDGEHLSIEQARNRFLEPDEAKRRSAAKAMAETFEANLRLFSHITNSLVRDKAISDQWRGFKQPQDSRHLANKVNGRAVDALEQAVVAHYPRLSHRYYALKAKWLGKEKMPYWDRNAPLDPVPTVVPWEEAKTIVLGAYRAFSPEMALLADRFFEERWIDAPVRAGKLPGAFAHPTVPAVHPYILLNYQGKQRDVMTLAHELGHGVHQLLAARQGALMASTPLTLAETASVFGERLAFQALLDKVVDERERRSLIVQKVEDALSTVVRQIAFYRFEKRLHGERLDGELTPQRIGEIWVETQAESLGPAVDLQGYEVSWAQIPHFIHAPFYVYAYAFGDCLANSLFALYERSDGDFVERYLSLLAAGGSKTHEAALEPFGFDIGDPTFWSIGLEKITRMIDGLE